MQKRPDPFEKARFARVFAKAFTHFFRKRPQYANQEVTDFDALRHVQVVRHIGVKHLTAVITAQNFTQAKQFGGLARATVAGEQICPGTVGKVDLVGEFLHRVTLASAVDTFYVQRVAQAVLHQRLVPEGDGPIEVQLVIELFGAVAQFAHGFDLVRRLK